jgi:eukaryotic-like serine/threonine-protein kinase
MLKPGEKIGDWVVDSVLGEGGMGAVYRVHSALSGRVEAALKVMKPSLEADARARFVREAEALSALRHPAVVRVMGFSEDAARGLLYMAMELAEGETLKSRLERGAFSLGEALSVFLPLLSALDHAHASGIYHRDIKPSNIILCHDRTIRLVDFGIAAARHADTLTQAGQMGTAPYLAPEVFRGEGADPARLDVYAVGLVLHEALTGIRTFPVDPQLTPAAAVAAVGVRKLQQSALDPGEAFPERLREILRCATDPDPARRPSIHAMRLALESLVERRGAGSSVAPEPTPSRPIVWTPLSVDDHTMRIPDPPGPVHSDAPGRRGPHTAPVRVRRRRRRIGWAVAALLAATVIGLGFTGVLGGGFHTEGPPVHERTVARGAADVVPPRAAPSPSPRVVPSPSNRPPFLPAIERGAGEEPAAASSMPARPSPTPHAPEGLPVPAAPAPTAPAQTAPTQPSPARPSVPAVKTEPREDAPAEEDPDAAPDLSGVWELSTRVESTDYTPFQGVRFGYRLSLQQEGSRITGQGQKVSENGVPLPPDQRTRILVSGAVEGLSLVLNFIEHGAARASNGTFRFRIAPDFKGLAGSFSSDAANTEGGSSARRTR